MLPVSILLVTTKPKTNTLAVWVNCMSIYWHFQTRMRKRFYMCMHSALMKNQYPEYDINTYMVLLHGYNFDGNRERFQNVFPFIAIMNTLRLAHFKRNFLNKKSCILIDISLKFVEGTANHMSEMV